ncbi:MAG: DUF3320 domain-containing protein, partial [Ignavibacteriae bacterium]|nr:DUF3320 domain-containing protein [Ignavibacteriota bacterium]
MNSDAIAKLEISRKELLDLGLRNPLINFRTRKSKIDIVDELSTEIYRILVSENKEMKFLPIPEKLIEEENGDLLGLIKDNNISWANLFASEEEEVDEDGNASRYVDNKLQTKLEASNLHARLLTIHNSARTFIEEQGVNLLYLALGFINWYESESSDKIRKAPLLLIPVELNRSSVKEGFKLSYTGEDIGYNLSLYEKFSNDFNIKLPALEHFDEINLASYFNEVEEQILNKERWAVERNEIVLSFFSFGKFLMYKDLDPIHFTQEDEDESTKILEHLLSYGFKDTIGQSSDEDHLDELIQPNEILTVLDSDSSQTRAILDVKRGNNLIIQGPPGTGKSQTITNLIADALADGKKVLFVAEKMAALEVVKRRLDNLKLGVAALELHSHKTNKLATIEELARTLSLGKPRSIDNEDDLKSLTELRDRLNEYSKVINSPILNSQTTFISAIGQYLNIRNTGDSLPPLDFSHMQAWTSSEYKANHNRIEELERHLTEIGAPKIHPFWGVGLKVFLPHEEEPLLQKIRITLDAFISLNQIVSELSSRLELSYPSNINEIEKLCNTAKLLSKTPEIKGVNLKSKEWLTNNHTIQELINSGKKRNQIYSNYNNIITSNAWNTDFVREIDILKKYNSKWWKFLSSDFRKTKKRITPFFRSIPQDFGEEVIAALESVIENQRLRYVYDKYKNLGSTLFNEQWLEDYSPWDELERVANWMHELHKGIGEKIFLEEIIQSLSTGLETSNFSNQVKEIEELNKQNKILWAQLTNYMNFDLNQNPSLDLDKNNPAKISELLNKWLNEFEKIQAICRFNVFSEEFNNTGLGFIIDELIKSDELFSRLLVTFEYSWYSGLIEHAFKSFPIIRSFSRTSHEFTIEKFRELDTAIFKNNIRLIALSHWSKLPSMNGTGGELAIIKREINKKRRHLPIRKLLETAGNAVQAIKPLFMMSPLSIANYISPGALQFDLVIFDEASQVKPVDAFGAILRGKQVVVVGDSKQLPPTNFFESVIEDNDEDESVTSDLESILSLFAAQNAPNRMLKWHYRSKHDSLIAVSNYEFYDNKLLVFPSPESSHLGKGLIFNHLPNTAYDRGKTTSNPKEAKEVAKAVLEHAKKNPNLTLGVAAFSTAQRDAIYYQLEFLRKQDTSCEFFFNSHQHEPFFIKNLENVQGDERDVIFISIGYGKTEEGYLSMGFGPLNRDGGERRLNVLITRARQTCEVFANFTADDIDLNRTNARGVVALKSFLKYAQNRVLDKPSYFNTETDSPFEDEVIQALVNNGYEIEPQVGSAGFRIDIGVKDKATPGRYLLGIECDGASYHSARSARDRDRLRQSVLENLGWRIYRIWSTEWFRDTQNELKKLIEEIEKAKVYWSGHHISENKADDNNSDFDEDELDRIDDITADEKVDNKVIQYTVCDINVPIRKDDLIHTSPKKLAEYIYKIVEVESPVHENIVMQKIANATGNNRVGTRIRTTLEKGINSACRNYDIVNKKGFLVLSNQDVLFIRDRSSADAQLKTVDMIPPPELLLALEH